MDGGNKGETASFIAVYVNKKKREKLKEEHIYVLILFLHRQKDRTEWAGDAKRQKANRERQQERKATDEH